MSIQLTNAQRWMLFALFIAAGVLNLVDRQIISVLKPEISTELGWSDDDYGTLAAWFQGSMAIALLGTGWLADRLGVKWASAVGVFAWSVSALFHGVARTLTQFVFCRVSLGATEAMWTPAGIKMMAGIFPPEMRSTGFGVSNAISSASAIAAPVVIAFAAAWVGWRGAFITAGVLGVIWAGVWLLVTRSIRFDGGGVSAEQVQPTGSVLRERSTWAIAAAKTLSDVTWWLMLFWMPDLLNRQFGLKGVAVGAPLALAYAGAAVGALVGGMLATALLRRGYSLNAVRKGVLLGSAVLVLPLPLVLSVDNYWAAAAILALTLAAHQSFSTNLFALITDVAPGDRIGRVTGFAAFCGNVGGTIVAKVAGLVLAAGLGYLPLLAFASVSYLLAVGVLQLMLPVIRARPDDVSPADVTVAGAHF